MNSLRASINSLWFAFLFAACASGADGNQPTGGSGGSVSPGGSGGTGAPGGSTGLAGSTTGAAGSTTGVAGSDSGVAGSTTGAAGSTGNAGSGGSGPAGTSGAAGNTTGVAGSTTGVAGSSAGRGGGAAGSAGGGQGVAGAAGGTAGAPPVVEPKLVTSAQNNYWKVGTLTEVTNGTADVTVNDGSPLQNWNGMGGTFNEQGWNMLMMLTPSERDRAMKLLFDATDGARFQYGRVPIGASDYAINSYTLERDGQRHGDGELLDRARQAEADSVHQGGAGLKPALHLWASPWTPPTWMKQGPFQYSQGAPNYDGGHMKEDATTLQAFALYLAKFVKEYARSASRSRRSSAERARLRRPATRAASGRRKGSPSSSAPTWGRRS